MESTIKIRERESAILQGRQAPYAFVKEHRKRHALEFQSKRNDHDLVMCNLKKLHSQRDCVPRDYHGEPVRPRRRSRIESIFVAASDLMSLFPVI